MSAVWTLALGTFNAGRVCSQIQLQDGTLVQVIETSSAHYTLRWSTDRTTFTTIYTWVGTAGAPVYIAADIFGNIFVITTDAAVGTGGNGLHGQAFTRGGFAWTGQGWLDAGNPFPTFGMTAWPIIWCNTGGGTNGAGHLLMGDRSFTGGSYQDGIISIDAGVLLAGSGTAYVSRAGLGSSGSGAITVSPSISPDGFGASSGLVAFPGVPNVGLNSWSVGPAGTITTGALIAQPAAIYVPSGAFYPLLRVGPGQWIWVYATSGGTNTLTATAYSSTAAIAGPAVSPLVYIGPPQFMAAASALVMNRVWVIAMDQAIVKQVNRIGLTLTGTTLTWDAAPTIEDTNFGTATSVGGEAVDPPAIVTQPVNSVIDFVVGTQLGTAYTLNGGVSQPDPAPNLPDLMSPANNAYVDVSAGIPIDWDYDTGGGPTQSAFAFRYKLVGAAGYQYWNVAGGVPSPTVVWNPGAASAFTLPVGALSYGQGYQWSVATRSSTYVQSDFSPDNFLHAVLPPQGILATWVGPFTTTSFPVITWSTDPSIGTDAIAWRVVVYTLAQTLIGGFVYGVSPSFYDTGVVDGDATSLTLPVPLPNNSQFVVWLEVQQTGGLWSAGYFESLFTAAVAPATPTLVATPSTDPATGAPRVSLSVQGNDNLLPANDSSFETSVAGYTATNAVLFKSAGEFLSGGFSMRMTASSAATMSAKGTVNPVPVKPLAQYSAVASFWAATTGRTTTVAIVWQDASHATISTSTGVSGSDAAGSWTQRTVTANAPANAAFAYVVVTVNSPANGEQHYVDCVGIFAGTNTTWTINYHDNTYIASVFYSDDNVTWLPVRGAEMVPNPNGAGVIAPVYDYESPPRKRRYYQAQMVQGGPTGLASPWSPSVYVTVDPGVWWWLKDPVDPTTALRFNQGADISTRVREKSAHHTLLGRQFPVEVSDGMQGEDGTITVTTDDDASYQTLFDLMTRPARTLLLQSPFGYQWYFSIAGDRNIALPAYLLNFPMRTTQLPYVQADVP